MGYWKTVSGKSARLAGKAIGVDSRERLVVAILIPMIASALAFYFFGASPASLLTIIVTFGIWPALFLLKFFTLPPLIYGEQLSQIEALREERELTDVVPNWSIKDLYLHVDPNACSQDNPSFEPTDIEILDKLATGRLLAWGRPVEDYATALRPIPRTYWEDAQFTHIFLLSDEPTSGPHVVTLWHVRNAEEYRDLKVNKAQALRLWPTAS